MKDLETRLKDRKARIEAVIGDDKNDSDNVQKQAKADTFAAQQKEAATLTPAQKKAASDSQWSPNPGTAGAGTTGAATKK